jgi:hypothetical protein
VVLHRVADHLKGNAERAEALLATLPTRNVEELLEAVQAFRMEP